MHMWVGCIRNISGFKNPTATCSAQHMSCTLHMHVVNSYGIFPQTSYDVSAMMKPGLLLNLALVGYQLTKFSYLTDLGSRVCEPELSYVDENRAT